MLEVDDKQVARIYENAMASGKQDGLTGIPQIEDAWRRLKKERDEPGRSRDLNLAAAEWFAFSRYSVATGFVSKTQMSALSYGYYAKKFFDKKFGNPNAEAVTNNPVSEPHIDVASWGIRGAKAGETDHVVNKVQETAPVWRSVDSILGQNKGGYRAVRSAE